ncbi:hypothetical protein CSKR_202567, partial [Clonorchis sinensis]
KTALCLKRMIKRSGLVLLSAWITLGFCLQAPKDGLLDECKEICSGLFDGCINGRPETVEGRFCDYFCGVWGANKVDETKKTCVITFGCTNCTRLGHTAPGYPEPRTCVGGRCVGCNTVRNRWTDLGHKVSKKKFVARQYCDLTKVELGN